MSPATVSKSMSTIDTVKDLPAPEQPWLWRRQLTGIGVMGVAVMPLARAAFYPFAPNVCHGTYAQNAAFDTTQNAAEDWGTVGIVTLLLGIGITVWSCFGSRNKQVPAIAIGIALVLWFWLLTVWVGHGGLVGCQSDF